VTDRKLCVMSRNPPLTMTLSINLGGHLRIFKRSYSILYDTIVEFNVDSKAELNLAHVEGN